METAAFFAETMAGIGVTVGGDGPADIHIHDDRLYKRVMRDRELGLGEAYQDGWWSANQLDEFLAVAQETNLREVVKPSPALIKLMIESRLGNRQTERRAKMNAQAHYDIGCGWGGFAQFAATRYDVHVTGISPAVEQVEVARNATEGLPVRIEQADYREMVGEFDRITSIGMMEHVGPRNLREFFETCDRLLTPDGMMLHHTIGSNEWQTHTDPWFDRYIFPGGVLPSLGQIARAAEKTWSIEDVHNFGPDYDRTLMAWHANISARWDEIPHYDEHFRRTWEYYLLGSAAGFRVRALQLFQVVFTKAKQRLPVYRAIR